MRCPPPSERPPRAVRDRTVRVRCKRCARRGLSRDLRRNAARGASGVEPARPGLAPDVQWKGGSRTGAHAVDGQPQIIRSNRGQYRRFALEYEERCRWVGIRGRGSLADCARILEERRQLEARAERARYLESLVQLAGGVAHDFNNLLAVILSNVSEASGSSPDRGRPRRDDGTDRESGAERGGGNRPASRT